MIWRRAARSPVATAHEQRQQNRAENRDEDRPDTAAPRGEERKHLFGNAA